jgi:hypothetical protein
MMEGGKLPELMRCVGYKKVPPLSPVSPAPSPFWLLLVLALGSGAGCGPAAVPVAVPVTEGLPEYTGEEAAVFDDVIDLTVFGRAPSIRPHEDPKLAERVRTADSVLVTKIATVTSDRGQSTSPTYQLAFRPLAPALTGATPTELVVVNITPNSPSYQFVLLTDSGLIGRVVVLAFKRYKEAGGGVLHWHVAPDNQEVRAAIEQAKLVGTPAPKPDGLRRNKESP